ncbi:MAG TPA: TRAP transporter fused permease subunit [Burkholderiales bacterium]|nr:TRAP transporter fused permease subunit [Burkholderiales bacterium]
MSSNATPAPLRVVDRLYYAVALFFFVYLLGYYWSSAGGPVKLAVTLVPVTFILFVLETLRTNEFYPRLPAAPRYAIAAAYSVLCIAVAIYMHVEDEAIGTVRAGVWNATDLTMGAIMVVLIMEYARQRHLALFVLNILLILYAVFGNHVSGMFFHPGLSWERVTTAMSVEMSTGVFSNLPQLALTLIGSFLLVLAVLRAFGCVESILRLSKRVAVRSPHALPQSAVFGSMAVGTVSGSGAANAITVGSATIPAMIGAGMPRVAAGAIETASSLGGQLMPPVMGITAFLMAEFMGRSYFDVVARGYAPAIVYYVGVSVSVYLLSTRYVSSLHGFLPERMRWNDWTNLAAFVAVVGGLIVLMATAGLAPMFAALYMFISVGAALVALHIWAVATSADRSLRAYTAPLLRSVDYFSSMTADLTLLLATLSIMTGAFVITGVPTKVGAILVDMAGVNIAAMALMAFFFGVLLGTGLPPAPTYIITALVIAPPMVRVGVDPWIVHFFCFFLAVWGELTPPTSVAAAITSKIAEASFMKTLFKAIQICVALFILMAGVFTRPELVLEPGLAQIGAMLLLIAATAGVTFSLQAQFSRNRALDFVLRLVLAGFAMVVLLHPSIEVAISACVPVGLFIGYWYVRCRGAALPAQAPATT